MKKKHNEGFSLIEVMLAIVILAAIVVPTCTSLVLSYRMNAKTEELMQAQLAVSSTVEKLMAEGIDTVKATAAVAEDNGGAYDYILADGAVGDADQYPGVKVMIDLTNSDEGVVYSVIVSDDDALVTVTTQIRAAGGGN